MLKNSADVRPGSRRITRRIIHVWQVATTCPSPIQDQNCSYSRQLKPTSRISGKFFMSSYKCAQ